jgi:outer membrane protein TolC
MLPTRLDARALDTLLITMLSIALLTLVTHAHAQARTLTLSKALELAAKRAMTLTAAHFREASAEAALRNAGANYYPTLTVNLSGGGSAVRDAQPAPPPSNGLFSYSNYAATGSGAVALRWTVFDFGRTSESVTSAQAEHALATADRSDVGLTVVNDVATAFLTLHHQQRLRDAAAATLAQRERTSAIAHGLVLSGMQPPLEELRASARVDAASLQLSSADAAVIDARIVLAALLLVPAQQLQSIAPPRLSKAEAAVTTSKFVAESIPSVRVARAEHRAKLADSRAAAARYLPTLSLNLDAEYRVARYDHTDLAFNTRSATGTVIASLPLFDATIGAGLDQARADASNAFSLAEQTVRDAQRESTRALAALNATQRALVPARRAAQGAAVVLEVVQARYTQGLCTPIELIEAETSDTASRTALIQTELAHDLALVRAAKALGTPLAEDP